ncbi:alpha-glucosidase/alpha-galactosidase [Acidothermaceae bacterium B102]|nr:alpha-glucosidase/alpha-galactosidase [Acidothermaceae bacterium B102]
MTTVTFIGAGSVEFTRELLIDLLSFPELADLHIALHDIDPDRLETAVAIAKDTAGQLGVSPTITASLDRREALQGASYVINSVQVGMHAATVRDFEIPAKYGLRQTIGDTIGVGGIFRALRTFPVLDGIAQDMLEIAPDAWLLNYTNPMAMNIAYLAEAHPTLKVVGLCHSVFWTVHDLCRIIQVPLDEVEFRSAGVNHQAWLLSWTRDGQDLYPLLDEAIRQDPELSRRVRFDMYRRLGSFPTETSEHSSEYVAWYLGHDAEIERLRIPVGDYVRISQENVDEYVRTRAALQAGEHLPIIREATEYAPLVIHAMETGTPRTIIGNVANRGLIDNLPEGYCVEVPCTVDSSGVAPQPAGSLPAHLAAVNRPFCSVGELTVRAAIDGDPAMIRRAAMVDPNASANLTLEQIWSLCDDMVAAHGDLLPASLRGSLAI